MDLNINYENLVQLILKKELRLKTLIELLNIDIDEVENELATKAQRLGETFVRKGSEGIMIPKPVYTFRYADCPESARLLHIAKVFSFAHEGSAYNSPDMSSYDLREDDAYRHVVVYDDGLFSVGLRFLPLYKGISYEKSSMNKLFMATETLQNDILGKALELGTTFIVPELQGQPQSTNYLFSAMAFAIMLNRDAEILIGRPTIQGNMNDDIKGLISSWMYETFHPKGQPDLVMYHENVPAIKLLPFSSYKDDYNSKVPEEERYNDAAPLRKREKAVERMVKKKGSEFPDIMAFYAIICASEDGLVLFGPPVKNYGDYGPGSWEFPLGVKRNKIATIHTMYLDDANRQLYGK